MAVKKPRIGKREAAYLDGEDATDLWAQIRKDTRFTRAVAKGRDTDEDYPPRLLYLMAAAVYRSVQKLSRRRSWLVLLDTIEEYADGLATDERLVQMHEVHSLGDTSKLPVAGRAVADATDLLLDDYKVIEGVDYVTDAMGYLGAIKAGDLAKDAEDGEAVWKKSSFKQAKQAHEKLLCGLIRDIFDNPYRPVAFDPKWRTEATTGMALKMYEEKKFAAMPILADALEEAGCDSETILSHCREPATHVRGCWVLDLVLAKE